MLSLVIPTYNEAESLPMLLPRLEEALRGIPHEVIIVDDDSPDGTWHKAEEMQSFYPALRVIRRRGDRGLSSAVVAGFKAARGEILAVMDADGQHDASLLQKLVETVQVRRGVVIASRYISGGSTGQWNRRRTFFSRVGTKVTTLLCRLSVHDPMSGFFAIDRSLFERIAPHFRPRGFKILFDLLMRLPRGTPVTEIPYTFAPRAVGTSKLSLKVQWDFIFSLFALFFERWARIAWVGFLLLFVGLGIFLSVRAWDMRLLVMDSAVRERTSMALQSLSNTEGWLISDLSLRKVSATHLEMIYRPHGWTDTPAKCIRVGLDYFGWSPCDAS
ncbi:MAG: polyprenol monophosphomannose synthase [Candidatus Peribacteraceae bacterium]|nr:polyprenol monophosphomannose synthase [Candidatus Peribacteraceae bacterium]MDD5742779.1 polyprenol monophosphomannose synthase [Candidatus Peribacteraceae bacterium]